MQTQICIVHLRAAVCLCLSVLFSFFFGYDEMSLTFSNEWQMHGICILCESVAKEKSFWPIFHNYFMQKYFHFVTFDFYSRRKKKNKFFFRLLTLLTSISVSSKCRPYIFGDSPGIGSILMQTSWPLRAVSTCLWLHSIDVTTPMSRNWNIQINIFN